MTKRILLITLITLIIVINVLFLITARCIYAGTTATIVLPVETAKINGSFITNPARIDNNSTLSWRLLFDDTQTESAAWQFRMPQNYFSGLTAKLLYSMVSTTTNKVDMEVEVMALTDGESDPDTASFGAVNEISGGTTVPTTLGKIDTISITLTNDDSVAANDLVIIRVNRDHDDIDDTSASDLELRAFSLEYTTN
ncbi:MAG: hypothetical protein ABIJ41_03290 [Candidatus Omnitrophota bacterium]